MIDLYKLRELLACKECGVNITIPKNMMQEPPVGCDETILGDLDGACRQYRCDPNIPMLEYPGMYRTHKDRFDPRKNLLEHLMNDSPETLVALHAGGTAGFVVGKTIHDNRKGKSENVLLGCNNSR